MSTRTRRIAASVLCAAVGASSLASCSSGTVSSSPTDAINISVSPFTPMPEGASVVNPSPSAPTAPVIASPGGDNYNPPTLAPDTSTVEERIPTIVARGRIVVGISSSMNLLGFQDPATGELEGFDVSLAHEIARDIFGDPSKVDFRFITSSQREAALNSGKVDIVARTMTASESRAKRVAFSEPYLHTQTRILTLKNSGISQAADLSGQRVCATKDSTFDALAHDMAPNSPFLLTYDWSDCLVALQQHQVQAIISDDAILSGIVAQDPFTQIVGSSLGSGNYSIGIASPDHSKESDGLVRQVNSTLNRLQSDGTWSKIYGKWLESYLGSHGTPPAPRYKDQEGQ